MVPISIFHLVITKFMCVSEAGVGVVDVGVLDPQGHKDTVKPVVHHKSEELWYVEYTAKVEGLHSVNVFFAGRPIPGSPYGVAVAPGKACCHAAARGGLTAPPGGQYG